MSTPTSIPIPVDAGSRPALWPDLRTALSTLDTRALERLAARDPRDERDELLALLALHDLHLAPIDAVGTAVRLQHHPALARLRRRLEDRMLRRLEVTAPDQPVDRSPADTVAAVRAIAARDLVPPVYDWIADQASGEQLRAFVALEGGPDGGFDDLVAVAQVGLQGEPKLELARNYWDEMGRGEPAEVHTELHHRMARAAGLPRLRRDELPVEALARAALGPLLATNRWLQPELLGALGLLELQAGPRCRKVLAGLQRTGAPVDTTFFYDEHARTDPRHGKDWLDHVIAPLAEHPAWATGMIRGARWRSVVNERFFTAMARRFEAAEPRRPTSPTAARSPHRSELAAAAR